MLPVLIQNYFMKKNKKQKIGLFIIDICVKYVGDCDGTIYPGQVKTCLNKELYL